MRSAQDAAAAHHQITLQHDSPDSPSGNAPAKNSGVVIGKVIRLGFDDDNDNKPDVLDFDGVQQLYINSSGGSASGVIPFMVWMKELATQTSPDIITTTLDAGTTYTIEVSKNFAEYFGARIPDVEITDPNGNAVSGVTLTTYPNTQPSMLLYTFTPAVSGTYTIKVCNANQNLEESDSKTDSVVFVYEELHNSAGENGYYARFVISNEDGSVQTEASMSDIIQLRKNFIEANPFYLDNVYGEDNDDGTRNRNNEGGEDITQNKGGYDDYTHVLNFNAGIYNESEDEEAAASEFRASDAGESSIPSMIVGIPYDNDYLLGRGFKGITNAPVG